jgi:hypothetical protein
MMEVYAQGFFDIIIARLPHSKANNGMSATRERMV